MQNTMHTTLYKRKSFERPIKSRNRFFRKEIGDLEKKIDELVNESKKNKEIQEYYEYSKAIYEWFQKDMSKENEIKQPYMIA